MTEAKQNPAAKRAAATREIAFEYNGQPCSIPVPPPGDLSIPSVFLIGLPKAGSTLLNRLMNPILTSAGLSFVALQAIMYRMGVPPQDTPREANLAFQPEGYAFGGFRSLPGAFRPPSFAANRTIILVRDPRDMLTSLYFSLASSHSPPGEAVGSELANRFFEQRDLVNRQGIDAFALRNAESVVGQFRSVKRKLRDIPHRRYRYEDVIFDKLAWVRDMLGYLQLDVAPEVVERVVEANDVRPDVEDPAQHIRKVAPGDHIDKLAPETIAELNEKFARILQRYDYT